MELLFLPAVREFICSLDQTIAQRTQRVIQLLERHGHTLRSPQSKPLGNGLFELRILGNQQIRIIYFFCGGVAVLVHIFFKKSMHIPKADMDFAIKTKKRFLQEI